MDQVCGQPEHVDILFVEENGGTHSVTKLTYKIKN